MKEERMEKYFSTYRKNIIGINQSIKTPGGVDRPILYADWTASGRNYKQIEDRIQKEIMPYVANTHTETNATGMSMTHAYHKSQRIVKEHVNADKNDVIFSSSSGMTGVINKFQRILGLKIHERFQGRIEIKEEERPIVFVTHMEHHSNQTSWIETIADVEIIKPTVDGLVSLDHFQELLIKYRSRKNKIAAVTSCSNVTGIFTPYHEIAKLIHKENGLCFVDFACSAPYIDIDMHPESEGAHLDAIYFSPHKFLGGPGASGILIFNKELYKNTIPDNPGGGTVDWTNPWGEHKYIDDIETREDGGTPSFLQTIKVAMCVQLKNEMGVENMLAREKELLTIIWETLDQIPNLHVLAGDHKERLGIISFYIDGLHYNVGVKLLNDKFGIQTRGGCSCAGTYGHYLLNVLPEESKAITELVSHGDCSTKPGWIRMSIHPTTTNEEVHYLVDALRQLAKDHKTWVEDYNIDHTNNILTHKNDASDSYLKSTMDRSLDRRFQ
ncbi:MAG: aminotransferase class V-fold PLP-dependent enzyme [Cyclobacteriaceae bacterium]|nr:aminotransferase class V-fold PLP-dependent enzyme [Cyclobacteriaceae bacterium]